HQHQRQQQRFTLAHLLFDGGMAHHFTSTNGRPLAVETEIEKGTDWSAIMSSPRSPARADID
ncbi:hypothetical protein ACE1BM_25080, partial [Aeromonas jandaei]